MKHALIDYAQNKILAICEDSELAHSMAEVLSYKRNGNAIYGLFKIGIQDLDSLLSSDDGRKMWSKWYNL